ncbi:MAG: hypothetical protein ACYC1L_13710 [Alphaproteobacteria bacterium]
MTVSSTTSKVTYAGNGATVAFAVPFNFFESSDLQVIERAVATGVETPKALDSDYTVAGGDGGTGTVMALMAPASSVQWTIRRVLPRTQGVDLTPNDPFPSDSVEEAHDRAVMLVQEVEEVLARSLKFPTTDAASLGADLPSSVERASKFLAFDASGRAIAAAGTSADLTPVSSFIDTLLDDADADTALATLGALRNVLTARGDLVVRGASAPQRLAVGAAGRVLLSDGTDPGWAEVPLPRGQIDGFLLSNNGADANNDIDVAAGACRDDGNAANIVLASALTKRLDAAWAAGTNQGGLDTGSEANSTWYHVFAIRNPSTLTVDVLFSTSAASPTMPSGYTQKRRLGSVSNDGSGNLLAFVQRGDEFWWKDPPLDVDTANSGSSAVLATLSVPTGVRVKATVSAFVGDTGLYLSDPDINDEAPSSTAGPLAQIGESTGGTATACHGNAAVWTNTSAQIRRRSGADVACRLATLGWRDPRGRDA